MQMLLRVGWLLALALLGAGCTKANPAVCCIDPADCASIGASEEMRTCPTGLACIGHECVVAECSTQGCTAQAPVCNVATNVCEGCTVNVDCLNIRDQTICEAETGSCVQCLTASDCGPTVPVCDGRTCRVCERDSECPSGACGDDGLCIPGSSIVYVSPVGIDSGECTNAAPCATVGYAIARTSISRRDIVTANGTYVEPSVRIEIAPTTTPADRVDIHGNGSTLKATSFEPFINVRLPASIRDLTIETTVTALIVDRSLTLERVHIKSGVGALVTAPLVATDLTIDGTTGVSLGAGGILTMDRVTIRAAEFGIEGPNQAGTSATITNLLVSGAQYRGLQLPYTTGKISFATIVDNGSQVTSGPKSVLCSPDMTIHASIVWDVYSTAAAPPIGGDCILTNTIAGTAPVAGATRVDPLFKDRPNGDYHLSSNSPAKDVVETGPTLDFERDPRPIGARFDLGADEAP